MAKEKEKKRKIKISSAKSKGRGLQKWVAKRISEVTGLPHGKDEVIESRTLGSSGVDVKLYGEAKEKFPFSVECKYQESWSVPAWIKQAKANQGAGTDWLLFVKKNFYKEIVIMDAEGFFDLYERYLFMLFGEDHKEV